MRHSYLKSAAFYAIRAGRKNRQATRHYNYK